MKKVAFHTLGCKVNQYETEAMEEMFKNKGYDIVKEEDFADIYVINTCTVTNMSDRKSRQFIRRTKKINQDSIVAVVGCYSQTSPEEIEKIQDVDVIIGTTNRAQVVDLVEKARKENTRINIVEDIKAKKEFEKISIEDLSNMTRAYIKIQDGCNQFCSYCIIPYARGPIRSREIEDILEEVEELGRKGFKEVVLTGIHVASFGKDLGEDSSLIKLIDRLAKIDTIERIRFSSLEPRLITREFMDCLLRSKKACDHFHLSLQSGSDTVLDRMNRKYTTDQYYEKVELIRSYMPKAGITTDIIVGFPGETQEEFQQSMDFVSKVAFSRLHVFKYSKREGTPAATMANQVDGSTQTERSSRLIALGDSIMEDFSRSFIGSRLELLVEEATDGKSLEGYSSNYLKIRIPYDPDLVGQLVDVEILDFKEDVLLGRVNSN